MKIRLLIILFATLFVVSACHQWDNFTAYYNTYYNMERLQKESEMEFEYQDEKKRITPRTFLPEPEITFNEVGKRQKPEFLKEFIIEPQKIQPVRVKLDSIIVKGSKILAKHPNSDYVEGTLYKMALVYFYRSEWIPSQIKCSELIDKFPEGDLSPDAHLLMAKNYLIREKYEAGKTLLSRCIDIAWQKERYDILSEAFRIEAEVALFQNDQQGALLPYLQAIAQSDDGLMRAKWQTDLAILLFRMHRFEEAERAFRNVQNYSPDYLAKFESRLYRASCLMRLGNFDESLEILDDLESDGKYNDWLVFVFAQRMNWLRLQQMDKDFVIAESYADTAFSREPAIMTALFEKGVEYFDSSNYTVARAYFAKTRTIQSPVKDLSEKLFQLLNQWEQKQAASQKMAEDFYKAQNLPAIADSMRRLNDIKKYYYSQLENKVFVSGGDTSLSKVKDKTNPIVIQHIPSAVENDLHEAEIAPQQTNSTQPIIVNPPEEPANPNFNPNIKQSITAPPGVVPQNISPESTKPLTLNRPVNNPSMPPPIPPISEFGNSNDTNLRKYNIQPVDVNSATVLPENKPVNAPVNLPESKKQQRFTPPKPAVSYPLYEIGRVHSQLGNQDSAQYYYELALSFSPPESEMTAKYLYVLAEQLRSSDLQRSDSLMDLLVEFYPLTDFGKEAMQIRGYTEAFVIDSAQELYTSGARLRDAHDYRFSFEQFRKVYTSFPNSKLAPRSLYNIGWTYETILKNYDSALYYYKILQKEYPNTIYAQDVSLTVNFITALRSGEPLPDSLKPRSTEPYYPKTIEIPVYVPSPIEIEREREARQKQKKDFDIMNVFKDPGSIFDNIKESVEDTYEDVKKQATTLTDTLQNIDTYIPELPKNPFDELKSTKDSTKTTPDSLNPKPQIKSNEEKNKNSEKSINSEQKENDSQPKNETPKPDNEGKHSDGLIFETATQRKPFR